MAVDNDFVGRTIAYPLAVDHTGAVSLISGPEAIKRGITIVLSTALGERVMRPNFGCGIWDLVFDPVNENTLGLMSQTVRQALGYWEPRIDVESVTALPDPADSSLVLIEIEYVIRVTNDRRNLVYPFYVIPEE